MSNPAHLPSFQASLRERATTQLTDGVQSGSGRASTSEAMAVLFKLASSPSTAGDARALLHELQVHQVEIDMQHEELRRSRMELENDLMRQSAYVEQSPAAFLVIDEATVLGEINFAGVRLLGAAGNDLLGQPLSRVLSVASNERLQEMLQLARSGAEPATFELELMQPFGAVRTLLCSASREVSSGRFMLVLLAPPASS